jgi:hypothetical protein
MCCFDLEKPPVAMLVTAEVPPHTTNWAILEETHGQYFRPRVFHRHLEERMKKDKREEKMICEPLKIMASFGTQTLPKAREF